MVNLTFYTCHTCVFSFRVSFFLSFACSPALYILQFCFCSKDTCEEWVLFLLSLHCMKYTSFRVLVFEKSIFSRATILRRSTFPYSFRKDCFSLNFQRKSNFQYFHIRKGNYFFIFFSWNAKHFMFLYWPSFPRLYS